MDWNALWDWDRSDQIRLDHQDCLVSFCPAGINKLRTELSLKRQDSEKLHKKTWRVCSFIVAHDKRKKKSIEGTRRWSESPSCWLYLKQWLYFKLLVWWGLLYMWWYGDKYIDLLFLFGGWIILTSVDSKCPNRLKLQFSCRRRKEEGSLCWHLRDRTTLVF